MLSAHNNNIFDFDCILYYIALLALDTLEMLSIAVQDLLLALLGFIGDLIIADGGCDIEDVALNGNDPCKLFQSCIFRIKDGCTLLTEAERDQINKIAPLGRYYLCFQGYSRIYYMQWDCKGSVQLYKLAIAGAIEDLMQEYVDDIGDLETELHEDPSLPLSYILQRTQKVF